MSYPTITDRMSILIDSLKVDSIDVMGWSDGGIVALLLAEKRPDKVRKIIAVGANNGIKGVAPPGVDLSVFEPLPIEQWEKENQQTIDAYMKALPRDWKKLVNDLNKMWYQAEYFSPSVYERIKIPVMIVLGDRDDIPVRHGLEMHQAIKNSQLCILPGTSHEVFTERPELMNQIAIDFFGRKLNVLGKSSK